MRCVLDYKVKKTRLESVKNGLQSVTGIRKCNGITNSGDTDGWG